MQQTEEHSKLSWTHFPAFTVTILPVLSWDTLKSLLPLVPHTLRAQETPLPAGQSHCQDEVAQDHASQAPGTFVLGSDYSDTMVS